ncbi:phosphoribosyltransferase [Psychromonas sp. KJ10-10]|uniref:phosphoribosyltransferase n=1 Tax=Psychromonas sp. KJ10-10 TaxID=3391823 RepID=UPI0039B3BCAE
MAEKQYLSAQSLLQDSYQLARNILDSNFKPTFIVAIWRGGAPIGIAVQEFLAVHGIKADHIAIRTSSYRRL